MLYLTFLFYECLLFGSAIIVNYFYDSYLRPPFNRVDVIASVIFLPILGLIFYLLTRLFKRFDVLSTKKKLLLSIPAFIISAMVSSLLLGIVFGL
ncbi:hypothetical protein SAMN04487936_11191 [Halobacillus dabanensis]|uniref:Uncharacterized protein n=1 Tax=Halobacillus dabanensis TaxID=240302 RepID=A0A1I3YN20_HALDA|nr:hypothetical protein SAMN04487936_11191 [Halobacillus dabanensis]